MKKLQRLNSKGFTLIEVIVVAAIIAILAGILVPMIFNQIDESKITQVKGDVKSIQSAVMAFRKDTGKWPNYSDIAPTDNTVVFLKSEQGSLPLFDASALSWNSTGLTHNIEDHLAKDKNASYGATWKGSYLSTAGKDPWEKSYVINADAFNNSTDPVWVMSAGPDGKISTPGNAAAVCTDAAAVAITPCDDIGIRIK